MSVTLRRTYVKDGQLVVEEVVENEKITVNKKEKLNNGNFVFVFQKAMREVVNANLGKNAHRILLYLLAETEFENEIHKTSYAISKELSLDQASTTRAMNELEKISIVVRDIKLKTIRLNYELAFKGSPKNYNKLLHKDPILLEPKRSNQVDLLEQIRELTNEDF